MTEMTVETKPKAPGSATLTQVKTEIEKRGITQAQAAREIGISPATLTQILNGTYGADPANQIDKIIKWIVSLKAQDQFKGQLPPVPEFVLTDTARRVMAALGYAQIAGDIAVIYGGAGLGKTSTVREYQRSYPNVFIATMSPAKASVAAMFEELCYSIGFRNLSVGAARQQRDVERRLSGTAGLLIIDEAQHLSVPALDALRSIHDSTGIGLALVGNETVYTRLTGGSRHAAYLDRLFSRIGKKVKLAHPTPTDVEGLAGVFNVVDKESVALLNQIGGRAGALRSVVKVLRLAAMKAEGKTPNADQIKAAWKELGA